MDTVSHMQDFQVIELRRYIIRDGERENFARYFETWFPEAFQQLGAVAFGEGLERDNDTWFTWLRGFRDMPARAETNTAFYYGPLWKEHRNVLNGLMIDSDNVLLLRPLSPERGIPVLPAVDVVQERDGAQGIVVMQVFAVAQDSVDAFAERAENVFAEYREAGIREAGVLVTLDEPNNFPQLPVRTDGPYLVWLGIVKDEAMLKTFEATVERSLAELETTALLRGEPELVVIDPARRSRLRWLPSP
ncbi:MAG: NIPSNAP family protein [Proteobacteria bacterium]|nr:NIPSNAP family protein [Pseudomonadota bacterium]